MISISANGRNIESIVEWSDCDSVGFKDHEWYPEFLDLASKEINK